MRRVLWPLHEREQSAVVGQPRLAEAAALGEAPHGGVVVEPSDDELAGAEVGQPAPVAREDGQRRALLGRPQVPNRAGVEVTHGDRVIAAEVEDARDPAAVDGVLSHLLHVRDSGALTPEVSAPVGFPVS